MVWIDVLCTNQRDPDETAVQIQIMGSIYERSIQTIAWFGINGYDTLLVYSLIASLDYQLGRHPEMGRLSVRSRP